MMVFVLSDASGANAVCGTDSGGARKREKCCVGRFVGRRQARVQRVHRFPAPRKSPTRFSPLFIVFGTLGADAG
ncbi:hypothetical protein AGR4B_pAt20453 [Agrobacterium tumefaciens str. CFBP 5621]|nr:hypothetical protein AGR4B_pAt20453 [Agrobacterium tumefaciens str. CFBP 5621]